MHTRVFVAFFLTVLIGIAYSESTDAGFCQVFGAQNTHFKTFDGLRYDYIGKGEYFLVDTPLVKVQIRDQVPPAGDFVRASGFTDQRAIVVVMSETTPAVQVRIGSTHEMEVYVGACEMAVTELKLSGDVMIEKTSDSSFTFTGPYGSVVVTIEMFGTELEKSYTLSVLVVANSEFLSKMSTSGYGLTGGLCGSLNGNGTDDLCASNGHCYSTSQVDVNAFAESQRTDAGSSLFQYGSGESWSDYNVVDWAGTAYTPADVDWVGRFGDAYSYMNEYCDGISTPDYVEYCECMNDFLANEDSINIQYELWCHQEYADDPDKLAECLGDRKYPNDILNEGLPAFSTARAEFEQHAPATAGEICQASPTITNFVTIGSRQFAVLDNTASEAGISEIGQSLMTSLPEGWTVARDSPLTHQAIAMGNWGTNCIVMSNGAAVSPQNTEISCGTNSISYAGNGGGCASPANPGQRVMITHTTNSATQMGYCQSSGDPHFTSFDGKRFSFQGKGEFILAKSIDRTIEIQARHIPWVNNPRASVNSAVSVKYIGDMISVYSGIEGSTGWEVPQVRIGGTSYPFTDFTSLSGDTYGLTNLRVDKQGSNSVIISATDETKTVVNARVSGSNKERMNVGVSIDENYWSQTEGLCGMYDADPINDYRLRDGSVYEASMGTLHNVFGMGWQIDCNGGSLFEYPSGYTCEDINGGQAGYEYKYEPQFDTREERQAAETECRAQGLTGADLTDCMFDISILIGETAAAVAADAKEGENERQAGQNAGGASPQVGIITNFVEVADEYRRYALIDNAEFNGIHGEQTRAYSVPEGWELSTYNPNTQDLIINGGHEWPCECVVFASGLSMRTDTLQPAGSFCGENDITNFGESYSVTGPGKRILIEQRLPEPEDYTPPKGSAICSSTGDPHFRTFDGKRYNFYGVGEYYLVKTLDDSVTVQVRHRKTGRASANRAVVVAAGAKSDPSHVSFAILTEPSFHMRLTSPEGVTDMTEIYGVKYVDTPVGVMEIADEGQQVFVSVDGLTLTATGKGRVLNLQVSASGPQEENTEGLCGTFNYSPQDDITNREGRVYTDASQADIHSVGEGDWRLRDTGESFFDYEGATGPDDYWDRGFQPAYVTTFTDEDKKKIAEQTCNAQFAGDEIAVKHCMYDLSVNEDNEGEWGDWVDSQETSRAAFKTAIATTVCTKSKHAISDSNMVDINGRKYALLDGTSPYEFGDHEGSQTNFMKLPKNWEVAPASSSLDMAVREWGWGTECLVFADGHSLNVLTGEACGDDELAYSGAEESGRCYGPTMMRRKVLITESEYLVNARSFIMGFGLGHFITLDGVAYNFGGVGEYILYETQNLKAQVRMEALDKSATSGASGLTAITMEIGSNDANRMTFGVYGSSGQQEAVFIAGLLDDSGNKTDAEIVFIDENNPQRFSFVTVSKVYTTVGESSEKTMQYIIETDTGVVLTVGTFAFTQFINIDLSLPYSEYYNIEGGSKGLGGSYDADIDNDLISSSGGICTIDTVAETCGPSWRIPDASSSLMFYSMLRGESYDAFQNAEFKPSYTFLIGDDNEMRSDIRETCDTLSGFYRIACAADMALSDSTGMSYMSLAAFTASKLALPNAGTCAASAVATMTNTFKYRQYEYGLLDNANPIGKESGCQTDFLRVPPGWEIADWTSTNRLAVKDSEWDADAVVFRNGFALSTPNSDNPNEIVSTDALIMRASSCAVPRSCSKRVLIRRLDPIQICASDCNLRGECVNGLCKCGEGWTGDACEVVMCQKNCSSQGSCVVQNEIKSMVGKDAVSPVTPSEITISLSPFADSLDVELTIHFRQIGWIVTDPESLDIVVKEDPYGYVDSWVLSYLDDNAAKFIVTLTTDGMGSEGSIVLGVSDPVYNSESSNVGSVTLKAEQCAECACNDGYGGADCSHSSDDGGLSGWWIALMATSGVAVIAVFTLIILAVIVVVVTAVVVVIVIVVVATTSIAGGAAVKHHRVVKKKGIEAEALATNWE